jgi:hypothetical protein
MGGVIDHYRIFGQDPEGSSVVLVAQAAYHLGELLPLQDELRRRGVPALLVAPVPPRQPVRRLRPGYRRFQELVSAAPTAGATISPERLAGRARALVVMNDWGTPRELVERSQGLGFPTFGWVEGVQDFDDADTGRSRRPYRRVDHVLCLGEFDASQLIEQRTSVVGSQRLQSLWLAPPTTPTERFVTINSNFTYGVLSDVRRPWVAEAVAGCRSASCDWALSRHRAERGTSLPYRTSNRTASELLAESSHLLSRFSTLCLEALVRGVQLLFHNPHGERSAAFPALTGALIHTKNASDIAAALNRDLLTGDEVRRSAEAFLAGRLHLPDEVAAASLAADAIQTELS